jgi:hypothetical protein
LLLVLWFNFLGISLLSLTYVRHPLDDLYYFSYIH